jgi:hypothetical protein
MGYDIDRTSEDAGGPNGRYIPDDEDTPPEMIANMLDTIDTSKILDNNGKLKADQYKYIDGDFNFVNKPEREDGVKPATVTMNMNNALTEWVIGNILLGTKGIIRSNHPVLARFKELKYFVKQNLFVTQLCEVYLKSIKYINTKRIYKRGKREKGRQTKKVIKIINPETKREIQVDKQKFKKLYGKIILKYVDYKCLSTYNQIKYDIDENCAIDLLTKYENIPREEIEKILNRKIDNDIEIDELIEIYKNQSVGIKIYDMVHTLQYDTGNDRIFKIYGDHIYLLESDEQNETRRKRVINCVNDIDKYKHNKLIVTSNELFDEIKDKIRKEYTMIEYNEMCIPYKTNSIVYNPYYEIDNKILEANQSNAKSVYNMINNRIGLTGVMNMETYKIFYSRNCSKIRFKTSKLLNGVLFDMNGAYPSQLLKEDIYYPIPSINDYWQKYDGTMLKHGIYECSIIKDETDELLAPNEERGIYTYYEVEELKKYERLVAIHNMFIATESKKLNDHLEWLKTIPKDRLTAFIGWLLKSKSIKTLKFDKINGHMADLKALQYYYGYELSKYKKTPYISITKSYTKKCTGVLASLIIKSLVNIELFRMDKIIKESNKGILLNTIRTDSLGYFYDGKDITKPEEKLKKGFGYWKEEIKVQKVLRDYTTIRECKNPIINVNSVNDYKVEDIKSLLDDSKSFLIYGNAGNGKTYTMKNNIVPILNENNKKYIIASITKDNTKRIEGLTLASLFNMKSDYELSNNFKDIDYLIIDEAQLMTQEYLFNLDILRNNNKIKFILIGDTTQTSSNGVNDDWISSLFVMDICEYNKIEMLKSYRCDEKINKLIEDIKKQPTYKIPKFVTTNFQTTNDIHECKVHLCRFAKTQNEITKISGMKCETIIKNMGSTINEKYMIHDIKNLPEGQVITALTRAKRWDDIYIYI